MYKYTGFSKQSEANSKRNNCQGITNRMLTPIETKWCGSSRSVTFSLRSVLYAKDTRKTPGDDATGQMARSRLKTLGFWGTKDTGANSTTRVCTCSGIHGCQLPRVGKQKYRKILKAPMDMVRKGSIRSKWTEVGTGRDTLSIRNKPLKNPKGMRRRVGS